MISAAMGQNGNGARDNGVISLKRLYEFVERYKQNEEAVRLERTDLGNQYSRICETLTDAVDEAQGFYLWGKYDKKKYWRSIYLGKAGYGDKKSLKKRIREELSDERCCIWRSAFTVDQLHAIRERIHNGRYEKNWNRAMLKAGTTHIVWSSAPGIDSANITRVEADLIEALYPSANLMRPIPASTVQQEATDIFQSFRRTIHEARRDAFPVSLKQVPGKDHERRAGDLHNFAS